MGALVTDVKEVEEASCGYLHRYYFIYYVLIHHSQILFSLYNTQTITQPNAHFFLFFIITFTERLL